MNSVGRLRNPKQEIVILCAVELRTEPTDLLNNFATHRGQMSYVIVRKKQIGRPIRLKHRRLKTIVAQLVLIGVNQVGIRMCLQKFCDLKKRIGLEHVIVIEKSEPLAAGERDRVI